MIAFTFIGAALSFGIIALGLAWPIVARLQLKEIEKLATSLVLSLLGVHLFGWVVYLSAAPRSSFWLLPVFAAGGLLSRWSDFRALVRDSVVRQVALGYTIIAAWSAGWLSIVVVYSGGGWAADWFEHWERMRFFIEHWPTNYAVLGVYSIPARPPLVNVITGAILAPFSTHLPYYQLLTTLFGTLAFIPASLLASRFRGPRSVSIAALTVAFMVSPLFVQNTTFAWTKMPVAFFVLTGIYFFLEARDAQAPHLPLTLAATSLAAGILGHYSAGPYSVVLAMLWFVGWRKTSDRLAWFRATLLSGGIALMVLATWFAWTIVVYGSAAAASATTTVTGADRNLANQAVVTALNLRDTLLPHFLRSPNPALITQSSPWGRLRDVAFQSYQLNLFLAFGCVGWLALTWSCFRRLRISPRGTQAFWVLFVGGVIFLGVAAHATRDEWGLAHICLQPLIMLGLSFLVAEWSVFSRGWRILLLAGAIIDLLLGIVVHFAIQGFLIDRWFGDVDWASAAMKHYNPTANMAILAKFRHSHVLFSDVLPFPAELVLALLAVLLILALVRAHRSLSSTA